MSTPHTDIADALSSSKQLLVEAAGFLDDFANNAFDDNDWRRLEELRSELYAQSRSIDRVLRKLADAGKDTTANVADPGDEHSDETITMAQLRRESNSELVARLMTATGRDENIKVICEVMKRLKRAEQFERQRTELISFAVEAEWVAWRKELETGVNSGWYYVNCGEPLGSDMAFPEFGWGDATHGLKREHELWLNGD